MLHSWPRVPLGVSLCHGFLLLEEAEGTFGSAEQQVVEIVNRDLKNPFLTALGSRLLRQEEVEVSLEMRIVECRNGHYSLTLSTFPPHDFDTFTPCE